MIRPLGILVTCFFSGLLWAQGDGLPWPDNEQKYKPEKWELQPLTNAPRQRPVFKPVVLGQPGVPGNTKSIQVVAIPHPEYLSQTTSPSDSGVTLSVASPPPDMDNRAEPNTRAAIDSSPGLSPNSSENSDSKNNTGQKRDSIQAILSFDELPNASFLDSLFLEDVRTESGLASFFSEETGETAVSSDSSALPPQDANESDKEAKGASENSGHSQTLSEANESDKEAKGASENSGHSQTLSEANESDKEAEGASENPGHSQTLSDANESDKEAKGASEIPGHSQTLSIVQSILENPAPLIPPVDPIPSPSTISRPPVITSLNKHIPSLTSYQSRKVAPKPVNQLFDPGKFQDCFPRIVRTGLWAEQAPYLSAPPNPESFGQFEASWEPALIEEMADSLNKGRSTLKLNDAGMYLMTLTLSEKIYPKHPNEARLLTALLMQRAGLRVQAVIQNNQSALLVNTRQALFGIPALRREGTWGDNWYLWHGNITEGLSSSVLAPESGEPGLLKPLDLNLYEFPQIPGESITRQLIYTDGVTKTQDTFYIELNLGAIRLLASLPQMSPEVYFNAAISQGVGTTLIQQLKKRLAPMRSYESLGWLLRFVQNAFPYQTDETQFSAEKAMFLEETLVFPYTDCEDRSVLFGLLVKEVLGRNIIGLDFPGHMAVGVVTPRREARGAKLVYRGNLYMACDPSYKRALPGTLSENILRQDPKAIPVRRLGMPFEAGKDF